MNLHYVASVAEEIGLVGGRLASYSVHPTIGISCDVAFVSDATPEEAKVIGDVRLGSGVALARGPIYHEDFAISSRQPPRRKGLRIR